MILAAVLAAGSRAGQPAMPRQPFHTSQGSPGAYSEDQHWGGFDACSDRSVVLTQIMWIQQSPSLMGGTFVFEVRHSNGTLLCSGSVACDAAADTDTRAACDATLGPGEHANLMAGASSTCTTLPGGRFNVEGYYSR